MISDSNKGRIAYLEDDAIQSEQVSSWLVKAGYQCSSFSDAVSMQEALESCKFVAVLLDWHLEAGGSGLDVLRYLRITQRSHLPVVFLSSKNTKNDIATIYNAGADYFLSKPVAENDLVKLLDNYVQNRPKCVNVIGYGPYQDDTVNQKFSLHGETVDMSTGDYALASYLFAQAGRVVSTEALLSIVKEHAGEMDKKRIESHIHKLRKTIRLRELGRWQLETIHGYGYRLNRIGSSSPVL